MEHYITHACGHQQTHYLRGFAGAQDRKASWLAKTSCRSCYVADKRATEAAEAAANHFALGPLGLPELVGSERQVTWATSIRALRLGTLVPDLIANDAGERGWYRETDAKWWIDNRAVADAELLARARAHQVLD